MQQDIRERLLSRESAWQILIQRFAPAPSCLQALDKSNQILSMTSGPAVEVRSFRVQSNAAELIGLPSNLQMSLENRASCASDSLFSAVAQLLTGKVGNHRVLFREISMIVWLFT